MLNIPQGAVRVPIIGPDVPILGMYSGIERSALSPGQFPLLRDARFDDEGLRVRRGVVSVLGKPSWAVSDFPLGAISVTLAGERYVAAAFSDGAAVRIAIAPEGVNRWVDVTGSASWTGPAGNNRLTDLTSPVSFTVVPTLRAADLTDVKSSHDALLIQNGEDYPRIWDPSTEIETDVVVLAASYATPIRIQHGGSHLVTGDHIWIEGVTGNTAANGLWNITVIDGTHFDLVGSAGNGPYTGGGVIRDRADFQVHKPITVPSTQGTSFVTMPGWPVAGTASKTYYAAGVVNQARFEFKNSTAAPYTNENAGVVWNITNAAVAADIATVKFNAALTIDRQLVMLWEGAGVDAMLRQCKIELNPQNVAYNLIAQPWETLFDPTGADATKREPVMFVENGTNARLWVIFDARAMANGDYYHIRFTRQGSAPSAGQSATLLFAGSASSDLPADTDFSYSYMDELNNVESAGYVMTSTSDSISASGGVQIVKDGAGTAAAPQLPRDGRMVANFRFTITNGSLTALIAGGLNGEPEKVNAYAKLEGGEKFYFIESFRLYDAVLDAGVRKWQKQATPFDQQLMNIPLSSTAGLTTVNYNREMPSAFQQPVPIAKKCLYANGRLFVGGIKDASGQYALGDVYFSWMRFPFRFQQVQEDELRGGYLQIAGETVQAFVASASAALGAGRLFLFTDRKLYSLGDAGPFVSSGVSATDLSRPVEIGKHGTLAPMSIAQGYDAMFWLDQDAQWMRFTGGAPENIGKGRVHDRLENIPAARLPRVCSPFFNDRCFLGFTPAAATGNDRALVWNARKGAIESEDYPKGTAGVNNYKFELAFVHAATGASGEKSRLFFFHSDGSLKAHDEDPTSDDGSAILARWVTGEYQNPGWSQFFFDETQLMITQNTGKTVTCSRIYRRWGADEPWNTTLSADEGATNDVAIFRDSQLHTKVGQDRGPEGDWAGYLDFSGLLAPDTRILRCEATIIPTGTSAGKR